MADRFIVIGSALVLALFSAGVARSSRVDHALPAETSTAAGIHPDSARELLEQVPFPREPIALLEVDALGNLLIPVQADALVTHDGVGTPEVTGMDIRGSRCARSVESIMSRTDGPFTVVCLPREYRLYDRMRGTESREPTETPLEGGDR